MKQKSQLHTSDLIRLIMMAHVEIESITIQEFPPPPEFQRRFSPNDDEQEVIARAMMLRASTGMPFPEATVSTMLKEGEPSRGFLEALGYHQASVATYMLSREAVLRGELEAIETQVRKPCFVGLSSRVRVAGRNVLHIPQIDFHISISERSLKIVELILQLISPSNGWILNSGKSYHFIGDTLIDEASMLRFLSLAILYAPFTDKNWIAHQIIERACNLRLFENPRTGDRAPVVVKRLERTEFDGQCYD